MEYVKSYPTTLTRKFTENSVDITAPLNPTVYTAAELEAAVALQTAGQFIFLSPGKYVLTAQLVIPWAARGGGLIGLGDVTITGAVAADSALKVMGYSGGTMEYTLGGSIEIGGGANKIGLVLSNVGVSQKTILYVNDSVHFVDNGTGVAMSIANTGTGAVRLYACCDFGTGWDNVTIIPKNADDKFQFRGISFDKDLTVTAVVIAANFWFENCKVPLGAKVVGGTTTNVLNIVDCWTMTGAAATAVNITTDFPDFTPTIV